jgi:hypothetical protein
MKPKMVLFGVLTVTPPECAYDWGSGSWTDLEQRARKRPGAGAGDAATAADAGVARAGHQCDALASCEVRGIADYDAEMVRPRARRRGRPGSISDAGPAARRRVGRHVSRCAARICLRGGWAYRRFCQGPRERDTLTLDALVTVFPAGREGAIRSPTSARRPARAGSRYPLRHDAARRTRGALALGDTVTRDVARRSRTPPVAGGVRDRTFLRVAVVWLRGGFVGVSGLCSRKRRQAHLTFRPVAWHAD